MYPAPELKKGNKLLIAVLLAFAALIIVFFATILLLDVLDSRGIDEDADSVSDELVLADESTPAPAPTPEPAPPTPEPAPAAAGLPPVGIGIGDTAPDFTLDLRGGGSVTLRDLRGTPVLLNVFTTWCPPCQHEIPDIQEIHETYGGSVIVLGVSIGETVEDVDGYFGRFDYTYMIAYDPGATIDADYNIEFIPQTWMIDANGVIVEYISGGTTYDVFESAIGKALN